MVGSFCEMRFSRGIRVHWGAFGGIGGRKMHRQERQGRQSAKKKQIDSCALAILAFFAAHFFMRRGSRALYLFRRAALLSRRMRSARGYIPDGG
jgi:hypothetical protein